MKIESRFAPLVIIGAHRSGTSLLARILHECGAFMGARRNSHDEATFFLEENRRVFRLAHAAWDNPEPITRLPDCQDVRSQLVTVLKNQVTSPRIMGYLGLTNYLRFRGLENMDRQWGWKDPRSTYTLPIWMDVFSDIRVVHLCRNGIDVAFSLLKREQHRQDRLHNRLFSCRCSSLEGAFSLWAEYESTCLRVAAELGEDRCLRIRFEDFLLEPRRRLSDIARFLPTGLDNSAIEKAINKVNPERAYAFLSRETARRYYEQKRNHPLMELYGYDGIEHRDSAESR